MINSSNEPASLTKTKVIVDGRCLDILLTEDEVILAHARAMQPENTNLLGDDCCSCWPIDKEPCGFWDSVLNKCDCDKNFNKGDSNG